MFETPTARDCLMFCAGVPHLRLHKLEVRSNIYLYIATTDLTQAVPQMESYTSAPSHQEQTFLNIQIEHDM